MLALLTGDCETRFVRAWYRLEHSHNSLADLTADDMMTLLASVLLADYSPTSAMHAFLSVPILLCV